MVKKGCQNDFHTISIKKVEWTHILIANSYPLFYMTPIEYIPSLVFSYVIIDATCNVIQFYTWPCVRLPYLAHGPQNPLNPITLPKFSILSDSSRQYISIYPIKLIQPLKCVSFYSVCDSLTLISGALQTQPQK